MSLDPHGQTNQPLPKANEHPSVHDLMVADIRARAEFGLQKYGQPLRAFNGRDTLRDAYEEILDLGVYLRTLTYEKDAVEKAVAAERQRCIDVLTKVYNTSLQHNKHVVAHCIATIQDVDRDKP